MPKLTELKDGQKAKITGINGDRRYLSRVTSIGLNVGCDIEMLQNVKNRPLLVYGRDTMIALLENEFVEKRKWIDKDEFLDMVAVAESTPGPLAINSATYIGYKLEGVVGAALATLAVSIPSFIIIFCISLFLDQFLDLKYVFYAFKGIRVCVVYLILSAGIKMLGGLEKNLFNTVILLTVIAAMLFCSLFAVSFSSVFYVLISGAAGVSVYLLKKLGERNKK